MYYQLVLANLSTCIPHEVLSMLFAISNLQYFKAARLLDAYTNFQHNLKTYSFLSVQLFLSQILIVLNRGTYIVSFTDQYYFLLKKLLCGF